jgi:hypothetical protein
MNIAVFGPKFALERASNSVPPDIYRDYDYIASTLDAYKGMADVLISGGGFGVEQLAARWAVENGIEVPDTVSPNIRDFGKLEGFRRRNKTIVERSELVILFWDGKNKHYFELIAEVIQQGRGLHIYPAGPPAEQK